MTTWNTSLTRILKLSLSLMGKNSLGLINSVCQGPGRKRVNMHARYLLSLHQHSEFVSLASHKWFFCLVLFEYSAHIFSHWMCSTSFFPDKSSIFKCSIFTFYHNCPPQYSEFWRKGTVFFFPLSSVENLTAIISLLFPWEVRKKQEHIFFLETGTRNLLIL